MKRVVIGLLCVGMLCSSYVCAQEQVKKPAFDRYDGEITDAMIQSFLRVDAKRREILRQADTLLTQIMAEETLSPEQYLTIGYDMRTNENFLERVRGVAAELVEVEVGSAQEKADVRA